MATPRILVDSDVVIDIGRNHPPAVSWAASAAASGVLTVAGFTAMELIQYCRNRAEQDRSVKLASNFGLLWPDENGCRKGLDLFRQFHLSHSLGMTDALIAATALNHGLALHSFNRKHFGVVPGLTLVAPYVR